MNLLSFGVFFRVALWLLPYRLGDLLYDLVGLPLFLLAILSDRTLDPVIESSMVLKFSWVKVVAFW